MKKTLFIFLVSVISFSCGTNNLTLSVTEPAPIDMPAGVKRVGIINRTNTLMINQTVKEIDELLSLEMITVDSTAGLKAIDGVYSELNASQRFGYLAKIQTPIYDNDYTNRFSPPITQGEIIKICDDNNLDAVISLEFFDTDTKVDYAVVPVQKNIAGVNIKAVETQATAMTNIMLGWRVYGASGDILYDEFPTTQKAVSSGRGINPLKAVNAIIGQKGLVEQVSYNTGVNYAQDFMPFSHRVGRIYYVKGTDNFKIGKRLAVAGKWNDAATYWEKEINNPKAKIAGRAYYNMAIINEINGDLDAAINWAEQSYTLFNNKKALKYLNVLKNRKIRNDQLIRQQIGY